jgi:hypothetical protein
LKIDIKIDYLLLSSSRHRIEDNSGDRQPDDGLGLRILEGRFDRLSDEIPGEPLKGLPRSRSNKGS